MVIFAATPASPGRYWNLSKKHRVLSVAMTDAIIGCPTKKEWTTKANGVQLCEFWHGRDRFTGERVN